MQRPPSLLALPADIVRAVYQLALARHQLRRVDGASILAINRASIANACKEGGLSRPSPPQQIAERVGYVIPRIAARVPWRSDCLVQALAGQKWLDAYRIASEIRIGAARPDGESFAAHAWLVHDGRVLLGGDVSGYSQLLGSEE